MKPTVGCVLLCICIGVSQCFPQQLSGMKRKGFRLGAANRISHGFGKRAETAFETDSMDSDWYLSSEELVQLISGNPELGLLFVEKFIDRDGDGIITTDEIVAKNEIRR